MYNRDMAAGPGKKEKGFAAAVSARYPGLLEKIRTLITEAERAFAGNSPETDGSFLWEHSVHVAGLAFKLAASEKRDPVLTAVAALFHDAGKFAAGRYHEGDVVEEERAAGLAEELLPRSRVRAGDRKTIVDALRALYARRRRRNPIADLIHDADFLSKSGYLGVASFFTKSALRGRTLRDTVIRSLSKELTYAACLPLNMRTRAARALADRKSRDSSAFFLALLKELREVHDLQFAVRDRRMRDPRRPGKTLTIRLALPRRCERCGDRWRIETLFAEGVKCEKLEARAVCLRCGAVHDVSFCLPEFGS